MFLGIGDHGGGEIKIQWRVNVEVSIVCSCRNGMHCRHFSLAHVHMDQLVCNLQMFSISGNDHVCITNYTEVSKAVRPPLH